MKRTLSRLLALGLLLALVARIAFQQGYFQWDFSVYLAAVDLFLKGGDPYSIQALQQSGGSGGLPFVYPPLAQFFFLPFHFLPGPVAYEVWLGLKLLALYGLLRIWRREVFPFEWNWKTILFLIFAFNACIYWDLAAGNVALFQVFLIWSALVCWRRRRHLLFGVLLGLAAQFKVTPLFLSILPLVLEERINVKGFLLAFLPGAVLLGLNPVLFPQATHLFVQAASVLDERGLAAASGLALLRDAADLAGSLGLPLPGALDEVLFGVLALGILGGSLVLLRKTRRADAQGRLFFVLLTYLLILPRVKAYSYILVVIPSLAILLGSREKLLIPFLVLLTVLPHANSPLPLTRVLPLLSEYTPLFALLGLWAVQGADLLREGRKVENGVPGRAASG